MKEKDLVRKFTGSWEDDLKKLPKYQRKEIVRAMQVKKAVEMFSFGIYSLDGLSQELRKIIK